jgi:hypothetical protein
VIQVGDPLWGSTVVAWLPPHRTQCHRQRGGDPLRGHPGRWSPGRGRAAARWRRPTARGRERRFGGGCHGPADRDQRLGSPPAAGSATVELRAHGDGVLGNPNARDRLIPIEIAR